MKSLIFLFIFLIPLAGYSQLTFVQKQNVVMVGGYEKLLTAYSLTRSLKEKENTVNWAIAKTSKSSDFRELISVELLKARYLKEKGLYLEAKVVLENAIIYFEGLDVKVKSNDYTRFFDSYLNIYDEFAGIYLSVGNIKMARKYYEKSIEIKSNIFKKSALFQQGPIIGLAHVNYLEGNLDLALQQYTSCKEALLYSVQTIGVPNSYYQEVYVSSAFILLEKKMYKKALKSAKTGESLFSSSNMFASKGGIDNLMKVEAQGLIAEIYIAQGDLKNGQKWMNKAFEIYNQYFPQELNQYSQLLKLRAKFLVANNKTTDAYKAVSEMMQNNMNFLANNFTSLSEKEKEEFYDRVTDDLSYYFFVAFRSYNETNEVSILERIVNLRMETKGFILNNQNKIKESIMNSGDSILIGKLHEWQNAKELLAYELFANPQGAIKDSLNIVINDMERVLSSKTGLISQSNELPTINNIRAKLNQNEVAIEVIRYNDEVDDQIDLATIIIERNDIKLEQSRITEENEERTIKYYRNAIQFERQDERSYEVLWAKVDAQLQNIDRVYFSPDGIFNQVNISTLYRSNDNSYVLDSYQVINMTNLKDLLNEQQDVFSKTAYLFGRPQYDYTIEVAKYYKEEDKELLRSNLFLELENFQEQKFTDLPGTAHEIKSISSTLTDYNWEVSEHTGPAATEQKVKSIESPGILHIATHGFFLEASANINPMIKSGLVMAGVNNKGVTKDDGVLTAYEATNLKLDNTWLVILSACETGLGDVKNGEGVYGLQRALTVAGAANLMMTLWKVDDTATKELMIDFYTKIRNGVELSEAFRSSQLDLKKRYAHPKYWGAFVLVKAKD